MKRNKTTILIETTKEVKKVFYSNCYSLGVTPMRIILILMKRFIEGQINVMPILEDYEEFKNEDIKNRTQRLLVNRIDGDKAHRINIKKKELLLKKENDL